MRILRIHPDHPSDYCCNLFWILSDLNRGKDLNTLVDAGSSHPGNLEFLLREMERHPKGIGRTAVDQVVLTHGHYDHVGGLSAIVEHFRPEVLAFHSGPGVTRRVRNGEWIRMGDKDFRVLHTPGHSEDSICLYCPETRDLLSGDTLYRISDTGGTYPSCYVQSLERIKELRAAVIHPGHGETITAGVEAFIDEVLANVQGSALHP